MKSIIAIAILAASLIGARAQVIPPGVTNIIGQIDESTNLFSVGEVTLELGGVYVQKTGEGGVLLDVAKWDIFSITNLGVGAQFIDSASQPAAEFGYLAYRKTLGNVAAWIFAGMGYNEIDKKLMGVAGFGLEHRSSKHISEFTKLGYGFEAAAGQKRGMVVGGGLQYNF